MIRVVLDTCVLFAALRSSRGASFKILDSLPCPRFQIVISVPVFLEYEEVLLRPGQFPDISPPEIEAFLDFIAKIAEHQKIDFLWRSVLRDPDDDFILELAIAAQADAIITHNLADFSGTVRFGLRVLSPAQFIAEMSL